MSPTIHRLEEAGGYAQSGEFGLTGAPDEFDLGTKRRGGGLEKRRAVAGIARRGRRQHAHIRDAEVAAQNPEGPKRRQGSRHRLGPEQPRGGDALAEPAQDLFVENRCRSATQPIIGDEPDRIRSDVDDGDRLGDAGPRSVWRCLFADVSGEVRAVGGESWGWIHEEICHVLRDSGSS